MKVSDRDIIRAWAIDGVCRIGRKPIEDDDSPLFSEGALMLMQVAELFGHTLDKETASKALVSDMLEEAMDSSVRKGLGTPYEVIGSPQLQFIIAALELWGNAAYTIYENGGSLE